MFRVKTIAAEEMVVTNLSTTSGIIFDFHSGKNESLSKED